MNDPNEQPGVAGGAPQLSLEDEEKAMRSGKGRMLVGMAVAVVAAIVAVGIAIATTGGDENYRQLGRNINGYRAEYFDAFWGCSLRGSDISEISNNTQLGAAIHKRAANGRARYGQQVRDTCMPMLDELEPKLDTLLPPEEMQADVRSLADSVRALRSGWSDYIAHLDGLGAGTAYNEEAAAERVTKLTKGWYDYRRTHNKINRDLRAHLGEDE